MHATETSPEELDVDEVIRWRCEELERAGYAPQQAHLLAITLHVDLHQAVDVIQRGCPPDTAIRILV